jgi:uncharacterized protein YndB with AHSA1/START domain
MPTARRARTIPASRQELWETISDPHHLPRWWPRVGRVEDVTGNEFTELLRTKSGKFVRADFTIARADPDAGRLCWEQRVAGSPFARLLRSAETEVSLREVPAAGARPSSGGSGRDDRDGEDGGQAGSKRPATEVTIELRQKLNGLMSRFGGYMVRRAAARTLDEALDGLERIFG